MTSPLCPVADDGSPGADVLALVDLDELNARLWALPTAALLGKLQSIVVAIDATDAARQRRRAGFFGRLVGRDLIAQAQPDPVETRVRLHLASATSAADDVQSQARELEAQALRLRALAQRLRDAVPPRSGGAAEDDAMARRRHHLHAVASTWDSAAVHVEQSLAHARQLLERHAQVRDLLVPAWRRHASIVALASQRDRDATARLHDALRAQITTLRDALVPPTSPTHRTDIITAGIDAARATQEPSP